MVNAIWEENMVSIEKADSDDLEEILRLQYLCFLSEAELIGNMDIPPLRETLSMIKDEYRIGIILKMVDENGAIIGSVRAKEEDGTVYIGRLMVHPDKRSKGYGSLLLQKIERCFKEKRYELFTSSKSRNNLKFYQKAGYKEFTRQSIKDYLTFVYLEKSVA